MNDEVVLQRALEDKSGTAAHIEELRAQIALGEQHLAEVDQFIRLYRRYAASDTVAPAAPAPAFAYAGGD